jgi:hypothetical protein
MGFNQEFVSFTLYENEKPWSQLGSHLILFIQVLSEILRAKKYAESRILAAAITTASTKNKL